MPQQVTCYITNLPPDHSKVLTGDYAEKMPVGTTFNIAENMAWDAYFLQLQLQTTTCFDYCKAVVGTGAAAKTYYYFMTAYRRTPTTTAFDLTLDVWATYGGNLHITGNLVQGHELLAASSLTEYVTLPVEPVVGELHDVVNEDATVRVVARMTVVKVGDYQAQVIVYSANFARQNIDQIIRRFGTPQKIVKSGQDYDVKSVDGVYIVPSRFIHNPADTEYTGTGIETWTLKDYDGTQTTCYYNGVGRITYSTTGSTYTWGEGGEPRLIRYGNMGTYCEVPYTGKRVEYPTVWSYMCGSTGDLQVVMRFNGEQTDLLTSLSVPFPSINTDTPQAQRFLTDAVGVTGGALSLIGSAVTGNALGIAGSTLALGNTIGNILLRTKYKVTAVNGQGLINTLTPPAGFIIQSNYLEGLALMKYDIKNLDQVKNAVAEQGFYGNHSGTFDVCELPASVSDQYGGGSCYRRFEGVVSVEQGTDPVNYARVDQRLFDVVSGMCLSGFWAFSDLVFMQRNVRPNVWRQYT